MIQLKKFLEHKAYELRLDSLIMTTKAGSGHPTSCLSGADLVAALFFYGMRFDPHHPENPNNDRFILSKGHAAPLLYAAWKEIGVISEKDLLTYRDINSSLEGHPTTRFPYAEAATGSLGMGLSIGAGISLSARFDKRSFYTYVLLGDGELSEGSVWEAAEVAAFYKLDRLVAIVDCNRLGQTAETIHGHHAERYAAKFESFGWKAIIIDGHDMLQVISALDKAREHEGRPTIIIAKTLKGYGVARAENKNGFHGKAFKPEEMNEILQELELRFPSAARYSNEFCWQPQKPKGDDQQSLVPEKEATLPLFKQSDMVSTRKAFGQGLVAVGKAKSKVVSLDAEVKNSTYAELFEMAFPDRFVQCFIAEQNMVSMAVGFASRGNIPFVSTFSAFLTRAYDQLRMAAIGKSPLRVVGSHAGVSIGQDGPSQMGLEDIAMMRNLPDSVVLYPADAVCAVNLVQKMADNDHGISYLRTTRMETPVLYDNNEEFAIGGCKVLRQGEHDVACVVAAGVTLFEALKAYDLLKEQGIEIAVIDLYSIKPLDRATVLAVAKKAQKRIITVEDHYPAGGIGEAVLHALEGEDITVQSLAVDKLPRSGKPEELLANVGIDANAIVKAIR